MKVPEPIIPKDIPPENFPSLLRNWHLGSKARRHLSRRRFATATGLLGKGAGGRSLDVGCGWGYNLYLLHKAQFEAFGIDIVQNDFPAASQIAKANGYNVNLICADVSNLPFQASTFEAVTAVETFEHIYVPDRRKTIREIARVLTEGGVLALSTPNYSSLIETGKRLLVRLPFLKRLFPSMCYPVGEVRREDYHPYRYHRPEPAGKLRTMLEEGGFTVVEMRRILFVWKNTPNFFFPVCRFIESILEGMPVLYRLGSTLVVYARKNP